MLPTESPLLLVRLTQSTATLLALVSLSHTPLDEKMREFLQVVPEAGIEPTWHERQLFGNGHTTRQITNPPASTLRFHRSPRKLFTTVPPPFGPGTQQRCYIGRSSGRHAPFRDAAYKSFYGG